MKQTLHFNTSAGFSTWRFLSGTIAIFAALMTAATARAAQAPPHNISAANLNVIQNDAANTEASVTVTTSLSINDMRVRNGSNRGDYNVQVGDTGTNDLADGMVLVAVNQNGRYNLDEASEPFYGAPAFDGNANGYWCVLQDVTSDRAEYNVNCAVAYFRYTNWLCGWARNVTAVNGGTNNLFTGSPGLVLGTHFKGISAGRSRVDLRSLGYGSTNAGVLLVNHAKNEGNFALSVANPDGTWEVYIKDNFGNANNPNALEQDPAAFVFIPKSNTNVVSGKFGLDATGTNAVVLMYNGTSPRFAVTNLDVGRYRLTIPGATPASGVLITSCEGGFPSNFDNIISYEADGDGWIIEHRDTGIYPPPLEACTNEPVASFVFIGAAQPGFTVTPTNAVTSEFGISANFSVVLDLAPTNDVTINMSSSNPAEGIISTNSLTFSTTNWNIPQTVTITGQDDGVADGPVGYTIILDPAISTDPTYNGLKPADVSVVNVDDETAGISVTPTSGLVTTESGGTATFSVFLNRQPTADVTIGLSSANPAEGTASPASLTFTTSDWSTPKQVTVTGVDDFKVDGDKAYTIVTAPAVSSDPSYNGVNPPDVSVVNRDNDVPNFVWSYSLPLTVIEGGTTNYSLALSTQPDANVVFQIVSSNPGAATVSPTTLTFTPLDWSTPKVITLTGVDNLVTNANVSLSITHNGFTTDPQYSQLVTNISLPALVIDNESKLTLPSGDCVYGINMPAIGIDGQASLEDADALSYNNGSVTVALTANGQANDRLEIRNTGTGIGQIGVSGTDVTYEGIAIGSFSGGLNLNPLVISLNANSTVAGVQQLIRSVTFGTITNGASFLTRTASVTLNDGLGGTVADVKNIRVGALRLTQYQEGGDYGYGYFFGVADIALSQVGHARAWPAGRTPAPQEGLLIDWPDGGTPNESQVLLRFDDFVGTNYWQIPSNAVVVSAELLIKVNNPGNGGTLHRMLIPWDATNDTWDSFGGGFTGGVFADDVEARSEYDSQIAVQSGQGGTGTGIISVGVTPDVQAWVSGETNYGWVILGWPFLTDGTGFSPSEVPVVGERPRIRVYWLPPGEASVSFRQGVNNYAGAIDTRLRQITPDATADTLTGIFVDAEVTSGQGDQDQVLIQFADLIGSAGNQIPPGAHIDAAFIDLGSTIGNATGDGGRFFPMMMPWDSTATWNSMVNGIQTDGVEAATTPTVVAGSPGLDPNVQGGYNSFEVTSDVQAWADGTRSNYGWAILPWPGGGDGWGFATSEAATERDRPQLRVYFSGVSANVSAAVIQPLIVAATQVQVQFTGTAGKTYQVLRASSVAGPWVPIGSATVAGNGNGSFTDNSPLPNAAFYRVVYP
jgi:hypothetical protein